MLVTVGDRAGLQGVWVQAVPRGAGGGMTGSPLTESDTASPVFTALRRCPNTQVGCLCTGMCNEEIEVVHASDYWRVVGERDALLKVARG